MARGKTVYDAIWRTSTIDNSQAHQLVIDLPQQIPQLFTQRSSQYEALDIGAGIGANSIFLAQRGIHVTAVEPSIAGISKLVGFAQDHNLPIDGIHSGILEYQSKPSAKFDLVTCINVLSHLSCADAQIALRKIADMTTSGGYHVIRSSCLDGNFNNAKIYLTNCFLTDSYKDWNILVTRCRPGTRTLDVIESEEPVQYLVQDIVAQKR